MKTILLFIVLALVGCASPGERLLTKVNDDYNYRNINCRTIAEQKVLALENMGIKAEVVHCEARDKYSWDHAAVKATINGKEWFLDNGVIIDVPWDYKEVQKWCYDFILP